MTPRLWSRDRGSSSNTTVSLTPETLDGSARRAGRPFSSNSRSSASPISEPLAEDAPTATARPVSVCADPPPDVALVARPVDACALTGAVRHPAGLSVHRRPAVPGFMPGFSGIGDSGPLASGYPTARGRLVGEQVRVRRGASGAVPGLGCPRRQIGHGREPGGRRQGVVPPPLVTGGHPGPGRAGSDGLARLSRTIRTRAPRLGPVRRRRPVRLGRRAPELGQRGVGPADGRRGLRREPARPAPGTGGGAPVAGARPGPLGAGRLRLGRCRMVGRSGAPLPRRVVSVVDPVVAIRLGPKISGAAGGGIGEEPPGGVVGAALRPALWPLGEPAQVAAAAARRVRRRAPRSWSRRSAAIAARTAPSAASSRPAASCSSPSMDRHADSSSGTSASAASWAAGSSAVSTSSAVPLAVRPRRRHGRPRGAARRAGGSGAPW